MAAALHEVAEAEKASAEVHAEEFAGVELASSEDGAEGAVYEGQFGGSRRPPFLQTFNPHRRHAAAKQLAFAPALAATAAALLGVACVRLYQDCIFWKRSGDAATSWHADLWTAPLATNAAVTVWLPLQAVGVADSPLFFQSRSHRDVAAFVHAGQMEELGMDSDDDKPPGVAGDHHAPLLEGDATWHHGWTVHGAPAIDSTSPLRNGDGRFAYAATYFADGAQALTVASEPEDGPSYVDWLPELEPGEPAVHELLPVAHPLSRE